MNFRGKRLFFLLVVAGFFLASDALRAQSNLVAFYSFPRDYLGQGGTYYTTNTAEFTVAGTATLLRVAAFGFEAYFEVAFGVDLVVGRYTNATRWPFNSDSPGLSISGNGRGCNTVCGDFEIRELGINEAGEMDRLWVTFTQQCECFGAPLSGKIRYRSQLAPRRTTSQDLARARRF